MKQFTLYTILSIAVAAAASANSTTPSCPEKTHSPGPDAHAPISVMGEHTHKKGEWMLSYRSMQMVMDGMRHDNRNLSSSEVFSAGSGYLVAPENMTMQMQMLGGMYAIGEKLTLMLMTGYLNQKMDHRINPMANMLITANDGDTTFTTQTKGIGDTKLSALYKYYDENGEQRHVGLGLSLPTGSIEEKDHLPVMGSGRVHSVLPAPMQLGSGTYDLMPSATFLRKFKDWSCGLQAAGVIRLEEHNHRGYRLGHQFVLTGWAGYPLADWISLEGGLKYLHAGRLRGNQEDINRGPMMGSDTVTTAYSENYGGERIDAILGFNVLSTNGDLKGHRLAVDLHLPLWQKLNGYQLKNRYALTLGWQKAW